MTKFVVVVGGVISGVGKGITTASLGKIIKEYGYSTTLIKIDPYINYDAGTLRPTEHGEVWVTDDGGEIDQDLGTYERFLDQDIPKQNNITTGQIYKTVIDQERRGYYLGQTVQFIPHIPEEIIKRIKQAAHGFDVAIIEVGGTVGDYENKPFLFAIKALEREIGAHNIAYVLVAYLPVPSHIHEMKTKPAQQSIKLLHEEGIWPDFIICRSQHGIDAVRKKKIETYAHIPADHVISAPDVGSIYQIPLDLEQEDVGKKLLAKLGLNARVAAHWQPWQTLVERIKKPRYQVRVGIVGKYLDTGDYHLTDSYVSIDQALIHAGAALDVGIQVIWIDAKKIEDTPDAVNQITGCDGLIIPGGFGASGVEGKISAIKHARIHNIPYLGLCYGLQLAVVEFARHVCGIRHAHTTEVDTHTPDPVIDVLPLQQALLDQQGYGGTMRLGTYQATLDKNSKVFGLYRAAGRLFDAVMVRERHRHRYEVNPAYVARLEQHGLSIAGYHERADGTKLVEFIELARHPFFIATQAHPEFKSRLGNPNPLFYGFIQACRDQVLMKQVDVGRPVDLTCQMK